MFACGNEKKTVMQVINKYYYYYYKFGDNFGCDDGQYFDEFGDVVDDSGHDRQDGASVLNADVEMEQIQQKMKVIQLI